MTFFIIMLMGCGAFFYPDYGYAATTSSSLYSEVERSVYQVRVISRQTGKKITIGSGFIVGREDILATNYHVVSSFINDPENYELDYMSTDGHSGNLTLIDVDVVHDLAVLKANQALGKPLKLAQIPEKGAMLYSVGNPLDLGFSIVTGTNNGELKQSADHNILFSGSLNAGMSGGPTLNDQAQVVGINVATSGNEISFLVSANHLAIMIERIKLRSFTPIENLDSYISQQLKDSISEYFKTLVANKKESKWYYNRIGQFRVPAEINSSIRCWDASDVSEPKSVVKNYFIQCSNERNIYLREDINMGLFQYQYDWYEGDGILPIHFYRIYENKNGVALLNPDLTSKDVTSFKCYTGFVNVSTKELKFSVCRRDYLDYKGLSDVVINGVMVGEKTRGFIFNLDAVGADFEGVIDLFEQMLGGIEWKN